MICHAVESVSCHRERMVRRLSQQVAAFAFAQTGRMLNQTRLEGIIDAWLPQTHAEAEAEVSRLRMEAERLSSPGNR